MQVDSLPSEPPGKPQDMGNRGERLQLSLEDPCPIVKLFLEVYMIVSFYQTEFNIYSVKYTLAVQHPSS